MFLGGAGRNVNKVAETGDNREYVLFSMTATVHARVRPCDIGSNLKLLFSLTMPRLFAQGDSYVVATVQSVSIRVEQRQHNLLVLGPTILG